MAAKVRRVGSPRPLSTLITSAPQSLITAAALGRGDVGGELDDLQTFQHRAPPSGLGETILGGGAAVGEAAFSAA